MGVYGETIDITSPWFARLTDDQRILSQAIYMRLSTAKGTYWTAPDYGLPLTDYCNEGLTLAQLAALPSEVRAEVEKDERIASVTVTATQTPSDTRGGIVLTVALEVTPKNSGPFTLTLGVSEAAVVILTKGTG